MRSFMKLMKVFIYSIVGLVTLAVAWAVGVSITHVR